MNRMRAASLGPALVALFALPMLACSDAHLFGPEGSSAEADRVALTGQVCAQDSATTDLPLRIVIVADYAAGLLFSDFDPAGERVPLLGSFVNSALSSPETELAVVGFASQSRKLAPTEGNFTRNPGELLNAVNQLSIAQPCVNGRCRNYLEGLRTARALIEGDLADAPAGESVVTQYMVVLVVAGPQVPLSTTLECCDSDDAACLDMPPEPSNMCQRQREQQEVAALKDAIEARGALGVKLHVFHLATYAQGDINDSVQDQMRNLAFSGQGSYQRFNNQAALTPAAFDVLRSRASLGVKALFVANLNAKPAPGGPVVDSDADGLSDAEEDALGTEKTNPDTDGDGITDLIESVVDFDPLSEDMPTACNGLDLTADSDLDGLSDCEEAVLGTEPTLVDSDGDGIPDQLELFAFTDYLEPDAELDADGDGVSNGDEVRQRSDPRSTDTADHLSFGYRYDLDDQGVLTELYSPPLMQLTGVQITGTSAGTSPGLGVIRFEAGSDTLRWQDAMDGKLGRRIEIDGEGEYELPSSSFAEVQGEEGRRVRVRVDPFSLPPEDVTERVRVLFRERHCLDYTVRSIRLMDTLPLDDGTEAGHNRIVLYFAETPAGRITEPGPFRIAEIPVVFRPPVTRRPKAPRLTVLDEEFVRPR